MILKIEQDLACDDVEVSIRYANMNKNVQRMIDLLQAFDMKIKCSDNGIERFVNASDILYAESVDKKTFLYLENHVYRTEFRLYQLAKDLAQFGFVQVSKSCILNINALESVKPLMNSRMEATLKNGEKIYINRKYLSDIKRALKGDDRR